MTFWSGEELLSELPSLITPYDPGAIDCASYELCVGSQAFVTRDDLIGSDPIAALTHKLEQSAPNHTVIIQPGQFAFLLTEETIEVPAYAIALISMKAKFKFRGLINVSGFHVDPGFKGKLVFSMYNAGPREIILSRGQKIFMIVYADLDRTSGPDYIYSTNGSAQGQNTIKTEMIEHISTGQVFSPMRLQREMNEIRNELTEVRIRARLIDGIVVASVSIFISIILAGGAALFASDTALATVGWWLKNAISVYENRVKDDIKEQTGKIGPGE